MSDTKYNTEYIVTGNTEIFIEDNVYINKHYGYTGIGVSPLTKFDVDGQIRLSAGNTNLEGEIKYDNKYLWLNTGGTINTWTTLGYNDGIDGTSGTDGESFTGLTYDTDFYYDTSSDTLYTDNIIVSDSTVTDSFAPNLIEVSVDYTGTTSNHTIVVDDKSSGTVQVTLPAANDLGGMMMVVKNMSSYTVNVSVEYGSGDLINGSLSNVPITTTGGDTVVLQSNGSDKWYSWGGGKI